MKQPFLIALLALLALTTNGQQSLDSVMASVGRNNKTLIAGAQYWEWQRLSFKTGTTLYDPNVSLDYMKGRPVTAGNQLDFTATQAFDFPTVYTNKKQLAKSQSDQGEFQLKALKQDVLLETKLVCLELIFLNKQQVILKSRIVHAEKMMSDINRRIESGDATALELNKVRINLVQLQSELRLNQGEILAKNQHLTQLNGGTLITYSDTIYPLQAELPAFEQLEQEYEAVDPMLKTLEQQTVIVQQQIDLNKSMWLPKFEAGYHYQAILGQKFSGVHIGMTIPLWENKYTVSEKEAEMLFTQAQVEEHKTEHYSEIRELYVRYSSLKIAYEEYRNLTNSLTSVVLLEKALKGGEISNTEFFVELGSYYGTYDQFLKIEKEYFQTIEVLNKYQL